MPITIRNIEIEADLEAIADAQTSRTHKSGVAEAILKLAARDADWLRRQGFCVPHPAEVGEQHNEEQAA